MFDVSRSAREAKRFALLDRIYHRGQDLAWSGRDVLGELFDKHSGSKVAAKHRKPLERVLGVIMWGELAAWKIAAQLADELVPLEGRMAAVSQAHDEARHFYVMHDYLERSVGSIPTHVPPATQKLLERVLGANTMPKKILGMQLQLEPMALTIFHALRETDVCPVLSDLLPLFEKDEARHVGLGVQLLPTLLAKMSVAERLAFTAYSFRITKISIDVLRELEEDLRSLGVKPRRVAILGKSKQLIALEQLWATAPSTKSQVTEGLSNVFDAIGEWYWPDEAADRSLLARTKRVATTLRDGMPTVDTTLEPKQHRAETEAR